MTSLHLRSPNLLDESKDHSAVIGESNNANFKSSQDFYQSVNVLNHGQGFINFLGNLLKLTYFMYKEAINRVVHEAVTGKSNNRRKICLSY